MIRNNFLWLLRWCNNQSDLKNEESRVTFETLDNPGWALTINLKDTTLEGKLFDKIKIDNSENDWLRCYLSNGKFEGPGGNFNLLQIIKIFRTWAENIGVHDFKEAQDFQVEDDFVWLQKWFNSYCNGDWEHGSGIHLKSIDHKTWDLTIELLDTQLDNKNFNEVKEQYTETDWFHCYVKNYKFEARCSLSNVIKVLKIFREFSETWEDV